MKKRITITFDLDKSEDLKLYEYLKSKRNNVSKFCKMLLSFAHSLQSQGNNMVLSSSNVKKENSERIRAPAKESKKYEDIRSKNPQKRMPAADEEAFWDSQKTKPAADEKLDISIPGDRIEQKIENNLQRWEQARDISDIPIVNNNKREQEVAQHSAEEMGFQLDMDLIENGLDIFKRS